MAEKPNTKYYSDFQPAGEGIIVKNVVFTEAIVFSIHYFQYIILDHFKSMARPIAFPNFTEDVEVWAGKYRCVARATQAVQ